MLECQAARGVAFVDGRFRRRWFIPGTYLKMSEGYEKLPSGEATDVNGATVASPRLSTRLRRSFSANSSANGGETTGSANGANPDHAVPIKLTAASVNYHVG